MRERERKVLNKLVDKFLAERRVSDGGWAPVTERDLEQLCAIIDRIIRAKWGKDSDGDLPVEWWLIDRTRFQRMHYAPVPYGDEAKDELALERLNLVLMNANIANRELDVTLRILQNRLREKPKSKSKENSP